MKLRPVILASMLLPSAMSADVLVNLDATTLPPGPLSSWTNAGTLGAAFTPQIDVPSVGQVNGVQCVTLDGTNDWFVGPIAPPSVTGTTQAVSIEVWALNPSFVGEETLVAWGRRGGPDGTNMSFNFGNDDRWGAVGHWGGPDIGWGPEGPAGGIASGTPAAGQWHYLVYTYDGNSTRVYADGLLKNSEINGQLNTHTTSLGGGTLPFVIGNQNNDNGTRTQQGFVGSLSIAKVRIRNEVLSPGQISETYLSEGSGLLPPAVQTFRASAPTYLPGQTVKLSWKVDFATSISIDNGIGTLPGAEGSIEITPPATATTYTITATNSKGTSTATAVVQPFKAAQLVNRWNFNEAAGNAVIDSVGGQNGAIVNQTAGTAWSRTNDQVLLPGGASASAPYIDLPNNLFSNKDEITIEGWITINGSQNWSRILDFGTSTVGEVLAPGGGFTGADYLLLAAQTGTNQAIKRFEIRRAGAGNLIDISDPAVNGQQFHFAVVYDADGASGQPQLRYYKNGVLTGSMNTPLRIRDITNNNNWLGRSNFSGDANLNGAYNEFRIWDGALNQQILADHNTAGPDNIPQTPRVDAFVSLPSATIYRGEPLKLSYVVADPTGGGVTVSIDQGVGPVPGSSGFVTVSPTTTTTYTLSATNSAGTRSTPLTVTVLPSEPVAENVSATTPYQTAVPVALIATDPNTPTASLTYSIVTPPAHGALSGTEANRTYTPEAGYSGPDTFTYQVSDGTTTSNLATVTIVIDAAPTDPSNILLSQNDIKTSDTTGSFIARLQTIDSNGLDTHTYSLVSGAGDTHNSFFSIVNGQLISQHDFGADLGQNISIRIRVTDSTGRSFDKVIVLPVVAQNRNVQINEIHYNPPHNSVPVEYVELHNPLTESVNVSGWRFTDGVDYTIPSGTSIPANGYLVISANPAAMQSVYGITALGPWIGKLSSDGERLTLRDHLGIEVDEVDYGINFPWPVPPNGEGPSMELIHPSLDNDIGSSWRASNNATAAQSYINPNSTGWRWRPGSTEASSPIGAWRLGDFTEDGTWATGTAPFGSSAQSIGVPAPATIVPGYPSSYRSIFLRRSFNVGGTLPKVLLLRVYHNDGAIVWLNGQEVARLAISTSAPDVPANSTSIYDNFTSWSDVIITNADTKLVSGANQLAVQAWGKNPSGRENDTINDFIIDVELRNSPDLLGTPGAANSVFAANTAPNIRNVTVTPEQPKSHQPAIVTARVTDPQGVGNVTLQYQVCQPGVYIPAKLPLASSAVLANPFQPRPVNPAFESPANWTSLPMVDDGSGNDALAGDGIYTATVPPQIHRSLVRYRITVADLAGASVRTPYADDPSLNFAYFVYNGVPHYTANTASVHPEGPGHTYSSTLLTSLPVYHWTMRPQDVTQLMAWNSADQFPNDDNPRTLAARRYENHEGALIYDGKVYDHVDVRLRGGNSRYNGAGKRHFKFKFQKGYYFQARDQKGQEYPTKWETMQTNKLFGNIGPADWGLTQKVDEQIFNLMDAPMPFSHWFHFRVIDDAAEQPDQYNGDFWGLSQAIEDWDARFLDAHGLPAGNLYKLTDFLQDGELVGRYLAEGSVQAGEDFDNYRYGAHPAQTEAWLNTYVDMPQWFKYNAAAEAVRHYDVFPEPTGRHRLKNWIWYFRPDPGNPYGKLVTMPYDLDATFGPTWNNGWDGVHNALYNRSNFTDSPTISGVGVAKPNLAIQHRNAVRHLRDLLWQPDQLNPMIDDALAAIEPFSHADRDRWLNAPSSAGTLASNIYWSAAEKAQNMKNFAFSGGNWAQYGGSQPVDGNASDNGLSGSQGRDAYLDFFTDSTGDNGQLPSRPTITYTGTANFPVDGLSFQSSAFSDLQGAATFGAMQWRIGEITDPTAPAYDPTEPRIYEIADVWVSPELATFNNAITIPAGALKDGHTYRARVRHRDNTARWSHWSMPLQFTTSASNYVATLKNNLMITEFMYEPAPPRASEAGFIASDFEFIELTNISTSVTLDLTNVRFTKGVDFDFATSAITSLAPGAKVLVVKNIAAFNLRYGAGRPVAGQWHSSDNLNNGGEQLKLSFGSGDEIQDFIYDNDPPWPTGPLEGGYSLVLRDPASRPDHKLASSWRGSYAYGGTPGAADRIVFADWSTAFGITGELGDSDLDGMVNLLEYALSGNPNTNDTAPLPTQGITTLTVNGATADYLTITFLRNAIAEDVLIAPEFSINLVDWGPNGVLVDTIPHGDGTVTQIWRSLDPITNVHKQFGRVRVIQQ